MAKKQSDKTLATGIWNGVAIRYFLLALLGIVGLAVSLGSFQFVRNLEQTESRHELDERVHDYVNSIEQSLVVHLESLHSIAGLFNTAVGVDREEFHRFTDNILERLSNVQALEWIPRVPAAERRDYERIARVEGLSGFRIREKGPGGDMVPAGKRDEYFPVYYVAPLKGNERALGFDLASNPVRRAALEKARDTGEMVVTGRIRLVQETGESYAFLAFRPVYETNYPHNTVDNRRRHLSGFALGVFRVADIVETTLAKRSRPSGVDIYILDKSAPADSRLLYFHPSRLRDGQASPGPTGRILNGYHAAGAMQVADRQWTVVFKPLPGYFIGNTTWMPLMTLLGGLVVTGLLAAYLVSVVGREQNVMRIVDERTAAVRGAEKELRASEERFREFAGVASDWMWEMDTDMRFTFVSDRDAVDYGEWQEFVIGKTRQELSAIDTDTEEWRAHSADLEARRPFRNFEYEVTQPDGTTRNFVVNGTPMFDAGGTFLGYRGTASDTTELKRAEDATRRSEERFRGAIENLQEGFALFDADDRLVIFNEKYYDLHPAAQDILKPGIRFEDIVRSNVAKGIIAEAVGREEEHVKERLEQHRNPKGPIVRELTNGVWYIINEAKTPEGGIAVTETEITDLKVAEAQVRESGQRFRDAVESQQEGVVMFDSSRRLVVWNEQYEKVLRFPDGFLEPGLSNWEMALFLATRGDFGEGDPEKLTADRLELLWSESLERTEITIDGENIYEVLVQSTNDGGLVITYTNITERKRAETAIRENAERTQLLHHLAAAANEATSVEQAIQSCLDEVCEYTGWPIGHFYALAPNSTRRLVPSGIWHLDDTTRFAAFRDVTEQTEFDRGVGLPGRVLETGEPAWIENVHEDPNFPRAKLAADIGVHSGFGLPVLSGTEVVAVLEFFSDAIVEIDEQLLQALAQIGTQLGRVMEREQAEAFLRESEERTRAVVDNVVDGIITINEEGVVRSINPAAELIFGYPAGELIGRNVSLLVPEPHRSAHDGYMANYRDTGEAKIIGKVRELEGQRRSGDVFPLELAVTEVRTDRDRFFVGIVRDITERKEMDRMKSEFVSTVSHELRTPLTSIRGSLGLVTGGAVGEVPAQVKELIEIAGKNYERLITLVNDILDMEKIESGRMEYKFDLVDLDVLVEQAIRANQAYGGEFDVSFVLTESEPDARIQGDGERLTQVMANLLSNAAKFSPPGQEVEVSIARNDGAYRVAVKDNGDGVPEEFRDRIFEKFSQADSSDARQGGGTGLGLSISRAIVEKHGGRLDFDSEAGEGATFYFDLPVWQERRLEAVDAPKGTARRLRVLICEDDPDVAALLALMLEQGGFEVDIAYNAKDAKKRTEEQHYDAMTVDIMLPDQDGIALIRDLRETEGLENIATVVVSVIAKETRSDVSASAMGIVDWLDKPINQDRLLAAVQQAARSRADGKPRVLYVEDDPDLVEVVRALLGDEVDLVSAGTLGDASANVRNETFDLVIIDILLPDGSGLDLLHTLRTNGHQSTPVVIFSGQDVDHETAERVEATLVKSRTSNDELLETVRALIGAADRTEG